MHISFLSQTHINPTSPSIIITDSDDEIIMSAGGLKLVSSYKILPDELFTL